MKKIVINPFENYSENKLLLVATVGNIVLLFLSFQFNTAFYGNLKINPTDTITLKAVLEQHFIILFTTVTVLFVVGRYLNQKTRFVDIFATCLLSRIVFCLLPLININLVMFQISKKIIASAGTSNSEIAITNSLSLVLFFSVIILFTIIWFIVLLYNGFKTATNAKGTKSIVLFIAALFVVETLSQILIKYIK